MSQETTKKFQILGELNSDAQIVQILDAAGLITTARENDEIIYTDKEGAVLLLDTVKSCVCQ